MGIFNMEWKIAIIPLNLEGLWKFYHPYVHFSGNFEEPTNRV